MTSKPVVMFIAGAVMAAGLVFIMMKGRDSAPQPAPVEQTAAPSPVAATPVPPEAAQATPSSEPEPAVPVAPAASARKPTAMPSRNQRQEPARKPQPAAAPQQTAQAHPAQQPAPVAQPAVQSPPSLPAPETPRQHAEERKPAPREPKTVTIPGGTLISVRVDETLSTDRNKAGDSFRATLDQPLVIDGFVIAERGSRVEGRVAEIDEGGRVRGVSRLALELVRLTTSDGQRVRLQTESFAKQGEKNTKGDVAKIGAAAGIGAAIGAIAGGGKGAAIGAAVGGAAGTGGVMATRGSAAQVPAETRLSFRLRDPITITEKLN